MKIKYRIQLVELLKFYNLPLTAVEIGVAEGFNSKDLLDSGIEKLYMVDNWKTIEGITGDGNFPQDWHDKNYSDAMDRIDEHRKKVVVLRGLSQEVCDKVPDESVSMIYIDGDHSYEGVIRDLKHWVPKVIKGGIIAGHDYLNPAYGVKQAVADFFGAQVINIIPENQECDAGFWTIKL
jgi:hypothetical protein